MLWIGIGLFVILLGIGAPIFVAFGLGAGFICLYDLDVPWYSIATLASGSIRSFTLLALPLFVLAGNLMRVGGSIRRLVDFFMSLLGHVTGGLAVATVATCAFFGALTGSNLAAIAAVGAIMIPIMEDYGYPRAFGAGLVAVSGTLGSIIPPSNFLILYGEITGAQVAKLFMASLPIGILIAIVLCFVSSFVARRRGYRKYPSATWSQRLGSFLRALPALIIPVIVLGGIYSGFFTPTEAAAVACVVAVVCGLIYRELTWRRLVEAVRSSLILVGAILILIATATFLSLVFTYARIPHTVTNFVLETGMGPLVFILLALFVWLILGIFMEGVPAMYIGLPIIFVSATVLHVDPWQLAVVTLIGLDLGLTTPPVAVGLYTICKVADVEAPFVIREAAPFWTTMLLGAVLVCFVPSVASWLPNLM